MLVDMTINQKERVRIKGIVDSSLRKLINTQHNTLSVYLIDALFPGRRMRPIILYMLLRSSLNKGNQLDTYIPLLNAVELIHRSAIILDDMIDNDIERRKVETFHVKYGVNATVLTSHYINALAYKQIAFFKDCTDIDFTSEFNDCYTEMVLGEMADINLINPINTNYVDFYKDVSLRKTNALFILIVQIVFKIKKITPVSDKIIHDIGMHLGNIYQMQNDIYDEVYSSTSERGPKDKIKMCLSLPTALILDIGTQDERALLKSCLGKSIDIIKYNHIRGIFNKVEYKNKLEDIVLSERKRLINHISILSEHDQNTINSFLKWVDNKYCWNHNELINAGY